VALSVSPVLVGNAQPACVLAQAPVSPGQGPEVYVRLTVGIVPVYLGGPGVTWQNGVQVAAGAVWTGYLFAGEKLCAVTQAGTSLVNVLFTGSAFSAGGGAMLGSFQPTITPFVFRSPARARGRVGHGVVQAGPSAPHPPPYPYLVAGTGTAGGGIANHWNG